MNSTFQTTGMGNSLTPAPVYDFRASITAIDAKSEDKMERPLRILDPACGSGRMLLSAYKVHGSGNEYYGIDIDRTCENICIKPAPEWHLEE